MQSMTEQPVQPVASAGHNMSSADMATESHAESLNGDLRQREWDLILKAIVQTGSRKATAERLGISQRTLRYKLARMREAGIQIPEKNGLETA